MGNSPSPADLKSPVSPGVAPASTAPPAQSIVTQLSPPHHRPSRRPGPLHPSTNYTAFRFPAGRKWSPRSWLLGRPLQPFPGPSLLGFQPRCEEGQEQGALHIQHLTLPFPRQKFKGHLSGRGSRHLPGPFLAIVAPLHCPRPCVFVVTKCKLHFPPSWLHLSLHKILPLLFFFSPARFAMLCGVHSPSWFHLPRIWRCYREGI